MRPSRRKASKAPAAGSGPTRRYIGSAQYHADRIADLAAGNTAGLTDEEADELLAGHRIALRAIREGEK